MKNLIENAKLFLIRILFHSLRYDENIYDVAGFVNCPNCDELIFVKATSCNDEIAVCNRCNSRWRISNNANDVYVWDWDSQLVASRK